MRIPCVVPFCQRTAPSEKFEEGSEIICGKHFRMIDRRLRNRHRWMRRWEKRHDPETYRNPSKAWETGCKIWELCKSQAIRARGWPVMTGPRHAMRMKNPGKGHRKGTRVKVVCTFDDETFDQIRALAVKEKTGLTEQIRTLVEFGLMDMESERKHSPLPMGEVRS